MNLGKIVADGTGRDRTGDIEGSTRGPRGPKNQLPTDLLQLKCTTEVCVSLKETFTSIYIDISKGSLWT